MGLRDLCERYLKLIEKVELEVDLLDMKLMAEPKTDVETYIHHLESQRFVALLQLLRELYKRFVSLGCPDVLGIPFGKDITNEEFDST